MQHAKMPPRCADAPPPLGLRRRSALGAAGLLVAAPGLPLLLSACGGGEALVIPFITFSFEGVVFDSAGSPRIVQLNLDPNGTQRGKATATLDSPTLSIRSRRRKRRSW
jgi:hypothetical protein